MRYFTPAWANGSLDEAEYEAVLPAYREHLAAFDSDSAVARFANSISLNDAWFDRFEINEATASVTLLLLTGDLQVGDWRTTLTYTGAKVVEGMDVLGHAFADRLHEVWYDEFTLVDGQNSHGFLLVSRSGSEAAGEFRITFEDFDYMQERAPGRVLST